MNKQGNTYTLIYIAVLVCIVGAVLAWVSLALKPQQQENIRIDKMQQMLNSIRITSNKENAFELYDKYITDSYIINSKGEKSKGDAFAVNVAGEVKKPAEERQLPVFVCSIDGRKQNISYQFMVPVYGVLYGDTFL